MPLKKNRVYVMRINGSDLHTEDFDIIKDLIDQEIEGTDEEEFPYLSFTIRVKMMTQKEINELPEFQG